MNKIFRFVYKTYLICSGILVGFALLDKYAAKILKLVDPSFKNLLLAKLKREDIQATKEEVIHIIQSANGINKVTN